MICARCFPAASLQLQLQPLPLLLLLLLLLLRPSPPLSVFLVRARTLAALRHHTWPNRCQVNQSAENVGRICIALQFNRSQWHCERRKQQQQQLAQTLHQVVIVYSRIIVSLTSKLTALSLSLSIRPLERRATCKLEPACSRRIDKLSSIKTAPSERCFRTKQLCLP